MLGWPPGGCSPGGASSCGTLYHPWQPVEPEGRIEDLDPLRAARGKIDLLRAEAESSDCRQTWGTRKGVGPDAGLRPDSEDVRVTHHLGEHFFPGAVGERLHVEPRSPECLDGPRVDVLQEERLHADHYIIRGSPSNLRGALIPLGMAINDAMKTKPDIKISNHNYRDPAQMDPFHPDPTPTRP